MIATKPVYNPLDLVNWDASMDSIAKDFSFYQILNNIAYKHGEYSNKFKDALSEFAELCMSYPTNHPVFVKTMKKYQKKWL